MKKILALLLALVMVLSLAACGGETDETKAPEQTNAPEQTTEAPKTEETTKAPEQTNAPAQTDKAEEKGCGGMIAGGVAIIAILGTALIIKKED